MKHLLREYEAKRSLSCRKAHFISDSDFISEAASCSQRERFISKNKSTSEEVLCFWWERVDTLCLHHFDRPGRCPKCFAVLETSQFQNAIAHFELFRRTPPITWFSSHPFSHKTKNQPFWTGFSFWLFRTI